MQSFFTCLLVFVSVVFFFSVPLTTDLVTSSAFGSSLVFIIFTNFILQSHLGSLFVKLLLLFTVSKTFAERSWWCWVSSNRPIPFHCINDLLTDSSKTNYEWMTGQWTIWLTINDCLTVTKDRHQWHYESL